MKLLNYLDDLKKFIGSQIGLKEFQREWRERNSHNYTKAGRIFPIEKVKVGNYSYGTLNVVSYDNMDENLLIGSYCSIAGESVFLLSGEHDYHRFSTFPFSRTILNREPESITKGPIILEDDVWIGYRCIIMSGVRIGRGAVIGAGSVVRNDIPPYAVFVGNRVIKYRFSNDIIEKILSYPFPIMTVQDIENYLPLLEEQLTASNLDDVVEMERLFQKNER